MLETNTTSGADEGTGQRIARKRRVRGLTQQGLADRAHVSKSLIQQVETGKKPATPSLVAAVATAMHVEPSEIYGQPYRGTTPHSDRAHDSILDVRHALACADIPPDLDVPPRSLDDLAHDVSTLVELVQDAQFHHVGARVPAVIIELSAHAHATDNPRAWRLLNRAIATAVSFTRRLGYVDLASLGIEHGARAAARSDDANLPLLADLSRSLILMMMGAWSPGLRLVRQAADRVTMDTPESQAVAGSLQLRAAILSARAGRTSDAWDHHGAAAEIANQLPARSPDFYGLQFNLPNVDVHSAAVAVELADYDDAVRRDESIVLPTTLATERRAHHDIDVARALVWTGQWEHALRRLLHAEKIAPQMTRHHPMARESVGRLISHHRALPEPLRNLQDHMGLA